MKVLFTGAKVVLPDLVADKVGVLVENGIIAALDPHPTPKAKELDLKGQLLLPGAVDLHCDAVEKEIEPRPGARFPLEFAVAQTELRFVAAGITVAFHAISFAGAELGLRNPCVAAEVARVLRQRRPLSVIDNRVHARYELTDEEGLGIIRRLAQKGWVDMVSLMDHSPGRGQFKTEEAYKRYLIETYHKTESEVSALLARKRQLTRGSEARAWEIVSIAREAKIPLASHDVDDVEQVRRLAAMGVRIAEFPVTIEAAQAAIKAGLVTVFGAPNILRGGSHFGSLRALEAVRQGVADCFCSDYSPASMLPAALSLPARAGMALHEAIRLISANPARTVGLTDRGEIAVGKRADLIAVDRSTWPPRVTGVWVEGRLVYSLLGFEPAGGKPEH